MPQIYKILLRKFMADDSLKSMLKAVLEFRDARDWAQYHTPKDVVMDLVREASEAMEVCLWETNQSLVEDDERRQDLAKEMADVLFSLLILSDAMKIDLAEVFWQKIEEIDQRYPAEEFKGKLTYHHKKKLRSLKRGSQSDKSETT